MNVVLNTENLLKNTEIGMIPTDWDVKTLGEISLGKGVYGIGAKATEYVPNKPRYLRITDIDNRGRLSNLDIKGFEEESYEDYKLELGDLIFARTGNTTGKSYLYRKNDGELVFAGFLIRFKIDPRLASEMFIFQYVQSKNYWNWVKTMSARSGQPGINSNQYSALPIPLPPLKEQQKIAKILSTVDEQIENTEQLIEKTKELKIGLMQRLLTKGIGHTKFKQTELGEIPEEWDVLSIENIASEEKSSIKIGPFGSQLKKEFLVPSGYKVYGQENVFINDFKKGSRFVDHVKFEQLRSCELKPGDFVITMMGTIGKCAIIPSGIQSGIMDSHLLRIRLNKYLYLNELLLHVINSDLVQNQVKKLSVGGIMAGLSSKVIRSIMLPVPPVEEQFEIATILSTVADQIESYEQEKEKYIELKKGLMQQLLTGKIRVSV